ncbi:MAG: hypothetical protein Q7R83_03590 [bacterium]|nr:hypothetical protein [bacterium]
MISLSWILIGWLILMAIYALFVLLTITVYLRYGVAYPTTYVATAFFLGVMTFVVIGVGSYFLTVDWSQTINVFGNVRPTLY